VNWIPEELDPEADQRREVYAQFGAAVYFGQVLEHGLVNFVVASQEADSSITTLEEREELYDELFRLTMGRQLRRAMKEAKLDDQLIEDSAAH
jgi:hypothetical protein